MADVFDRAKRSDVMARIRSANTAPEMAVRRALHSLGLRYRLHVKALPGRPDIVMRKYKLVVEVRGCFWHCHECVKGRAPKTHPEYWTPKLVRNVERDEENAVALSSMGWRLVVLWECEVERDIYGAVRRVTDAIEHAGT